MHDHCEVPSGSPFPLALSTPLPLHQCSHRVMSTCIGLGKQQAQKSSERTSAAEPYGVTRIHTYMVRSAAAGFVTAALLPPGGRGLGRGLGRSPIERAWQSAPPPPLSPPPPCDRSQIAISFIYFFSHPAGIQVRPYGRTLYRTRIMRSTRLLPGAVNLNRSMRAALRAAPAARARSTPSRSIYTISIQYVPRSS